jgi:hypothetical protein
MPPTTRRQRRTQDSIAFEHLLGISVVQRIIIRQLDPRTVLALCVASKTMLRHVESAFTEGELAMRRMLFGATPEMEELMACMRSATWEFWSTYGGPRLSATHFMFARDPETPGGRLRIGIGQSFESRHHSERERGWLDYETEGDHTNSSQSREQALATAIDEYCPVLHPNHYKRFRFRTNRNTKIATTAFCDIPYRDDKEVERMIAMLLLRYPDAFVYMDGFGASDDKIRDTPVVKAILERQLRIDTSMYLRVRDTVELIRLAGART